MSGAPTTPGGDNDRLWEELAEMKQDNAEFKRENAALHRSIRDHVDRKHWPEIVTNKRRHDERDAAAALSPLAAWWDRITSTKPSRAWMALIILVLGYAFYRTLSPGGWVDQILAAQHLDAGTPDAVITSPPFVVDPDTLAPPDTLGP